MITPEECIALHLSLYWSIGFALLFHLVCLFITGIFYRL